MLTGYRVISPSARTWMMLSLLGESSSVAVRYLGRLGRNILEAGGWIHAAAFQQLGTS